MKFLCNLKIKNISDSLNRYKVLSRLIKKGNVLSDETKLALAYSAFSAQVWGESQNYLDSIEREKWDERVIKLYKQVAEKSPKVTMPINENKILSAPKWLCLNCNFKHDRWEFVCKECNSVNLIVWPKKGTLNETKSSYLLQKSF